MRHIRNEDTVDPRFPKWTLDSHLKNLNVYVFLCVLENKYRLSNPLCIYHFGVNTNVFFKSERTERKLLSKQ